MNGTQIIEVASQSDIILARMRVRELARAQGLGMTDQARISLAASSLAKAMGLDDVHRGQMIVDRLTRDGSTGLRVACKLGDVTLDDFPPGRFSDVRWMVDELTIEALPSNEVQVTLVKWDGRESRTPALGTGS